MNIFTSINQTVHACANAVVTTAKTIEATVNLANNEVTYLSTMQEQRIAIELTKLQKLTD